MSDKQNEVLEEETVTEETPVTGKKEKGGAKAVFLRALDIVSGVLLLVVLSWLILLLMLAKWLEDFHNPIYLSKRVDKNGKEFTYHKIRTMCIHADELEKQLIEAGLNEAEPPKFKLTDDPRITWLGQRYRKYRVDRLPALINVIAGNLSITDIFKKR